MRKRPGVGYGPEDVFDELLRAPEAGLSEPVLAHEMALYVKHELTAAQPIARKLGIHRSCLFQLKESASPA